MDKGEDDEVKKEVLITEHIQIDFGWLHLLIKNNYDHKMNHKRF